MAAGFPGPDKEVDMVMDYFDEAVSSSPSGEADVDVGQRRRRRTTVVDMSCATGEFFCAIRRFRGAILFAPRGRSEGGGYDKLSVCLYDNSHLSFPE